MPSELRLTTADRTLNVSIDPSEPTYACILALLDPDVSAAIRAARSCKVVLHVSGGSAVDVDLSFTSRRTFKVPIR